jgi:hypothetical protein
MARRAIVRVNFDALGEMLFSQGTIIHFARPSFTDFGAPIFEFVVESDALPEVDVGQLMPFVDAMTHTDEDGRLHLSFKLPKAENG